MTAVILCPGLSLAALKQPPAADLAIAVNRAGLAFASDVAAISDYPLFKQIHEHLLGPPTLRSKQDTLAPPAGRLGRFREFFAAEDTSGVPLPPQGGGKPLPCARAFAFWRGAKVI